MKESVHQSVLSEVAKTREQGKGTGSHWGRGDDCLRWEGREGLSKETAPEERSVEGDPGALSAPSTQQGSPNCEAQQRGKA